MKFALIGNGFIASKHIEAMKEVGAELVAVCDTDPAKKVEGIPFYTDYKEVLDQVDAVSICTPNDTHAAIVLDVARKGKKILCEKPVTFKPSEIDLMKVVPNLFGVFQLRYLPEMNEMRKLAKGAKNVRLKVEMKRSRTYHDTWKGDPARTGGLLVNIGCHYFDLIGHLFGYDANATTNIEYSETKASGLLLSKGVLIHWSIALTDEQPEYERSITIDGKKFDLCQKSNLHVKTYENFMWGQGIKVNEEEKILRLINNIYATAKPV